MRSNALPVVSEPIEPVIEPKVRPFSVRAQWLTEDDCRLDASFYADKKLLPLGVLLKTAGLLSSRWAIQMLCNGCSGHSDSSEFTLMTRTKAFHSFKRQKR
jgi:hypothetical protein